MARMSKILEPLVARLRAAGHARWELIAAEAGVAKTLPRKLACGDRTNPTIGTVEPLIAYFDAVDRGERVLPEPPPRDQSPLTTAAALAADLPEARDA